jgi:hypothetical protein
MPFNDSLLRYAKSMLRGTVQGVAAMYFYPELCALRKA